jgi:hypothetical protein
VISWFQIILLFKWVNLYRYTTSMSCSDKMARWGVLGIQGRAVQVDPQLESACFQPLSLKCDVLVSQNLLFKFYLYRSNTARCCLRCWRRLCGSTRSSSPLPLLRWGDTKRRWREHRERRVRRVLRRRRKSRCIAKERNQGKQWKTEKERRRPRLRTCERFAARSSTG